MSRRPVTVAERRARLARRHLLLPGLHTDDVAAIAEGLVGLHSSDPVSVHLSAAARMSQPSITAVESALYDDRSVVRFHAMRRTLWVSTPATARLAHASSTTKLVAPERRRLVKVLEENGIADGEGWLADARDRTLAALDELGEATTRELGAKVPSLRHPLELSPGKPYAATVAAHTRVLSLLGFEGEILRTRPVGTWVSGQYRWAHATSWIEGGIAGTIEPRPAAAQLAHRYLRAFGPSLGSDLQWWAGWNQRDTRAALLDAGAVAVSVDGAEAWLAADDDDPLRDAEPWVALLPGLDPTTMGWKQRDWYLDPSYVGRVFDRNGNGGPTVWVDGRIVGSWAQRADGSIGTALFEPVPAPRRRALDAAVGDLERLLGDTRISVRFPAPIQAELTG